MKSFSLFFMLCLCGSFYVHAQQWSHPPHTLRFSLNTENGSSTFTWQTEKEVNSDYFLIEVSADSIHFKPLASRKAAGSSLKPANYSLEIPYDTTSQVFYRLTLVLMDGERVRSPVVK